MPEPEGAPGGDKNPEAHGRVEAGTPNFEALTPKPEGLRRVVAFRDTDKFPEDPGGGGSSGGGPRVDVFEEEGPSLWKTLTIAGIGIALAVGALTFLGISSVVWGTALVIGAGIVGAFIPHVIYGTLRRIFK